MVIDIIDLAAEGYQNLSPVQLAMVRAAQTKKNEILAKSGQEKNELYMLLLGQGVARSSMLNQRYLEIDREATAQIEVVREDLNYQLAYEAIGSEGNELGPYRYPENPNYSLAPSQRFLVVRQYYMHVTTNPEARLQAYSMDSLARTYLGEFYQTLYELLASYC
ncbi:MAG: hypothetical protein K2L87_00080 [Clostridiales bacterium]|nr:hypothetical protein [Clostridiales bacterium]